MHNHKGLPRGVFFFKCAHVPQGKLSHRITSGLIRAKSSCLRDQRMMCLNVSFKTLCQFPCEFRDHSFTDMTERQAMCGQPRAAMAAWSVVP